MKELVYKRWFATVVLAFAFGGALTVACHAQQLEQMTVGVKGTMRIDEAGNGNVQWTMTFTPPRNYDRIKRAYPNLYVLFRDFGNERSDSEVNRETLKITSDDGQRSITYSADYLGVAVCKKNRWQIGLSKDENVVTQEGNKIFTSHAYSPKEGVMMTGTVAYLLPQNAQNVQVDKASHVLTYALPLPKGQGEPSVDLMLRYKKRVMSAVYKVYADPEAQLGAYWVAKAIVRNMSRAPIYDLKIYYKLGEYTDMSIPERYSVVMPRGAVVSPYYPVISSRVAQLRTQTPIQLYVKYEYRDAYGKTYSEETQQRLELMGVNQFEFSNLNDEDRTDSWLDYFNNAPLLAAFVTRVDDAVKQFAGYVSEAAGGAAAASSKEGAVRWLKAAYEMQLVNNIVYQTPSGFMTADRSGGQEIKYPRDVFRDKSGTCVDLAITYAALAESVGLHAYLMLVPGHCFAVVELPGGGLLAVENTGLGGGNQRMTFEQAIEVGMKELQKYLQEGVYYLVNVREQLTVGRIPNPELPTLGADFLEKCGIRRLGAQPGSAIHAGDQADGFLIVHDHSGTFDAFCLGVLSVSGGRIKYEALKATDGRLHKLDLTKADIKEAKKNVLPMGGYEAFHIKLKNGQNYNFAHINKDGRDMGADQVLIELYR